jgi:hypothetical protein
MSTNAITFLTATICFCAIALSAPATYEPDPPGDTINRIADTADSSLDSTAAASEKLSHYAPYRYLTSDGVNFELTESDFIDTVTDEDDGAEYPLAVMLDRKSRSSGIGAIIPGAVLAAQGCLILGPAIMLNSSDNRFDPPTIGGSIMTIAGAIVLTAGIIKLHNYRRWAKRYRLPEHSRSPAVPGDSRQPVIITQPPEQRSP